MITYLSEDSENSPFLKLANSFYGKEMIIGTGGNTLLVAAVRKAAQIGNKVVVYLDLVPDNPGLVSLYNTLMLLYYDEGIDLVVLPIVCAEYVFIKSVADLKSVVRDEEALVAVLSRASDYKTSNLAKSSPSANSESFEKFCKLFCVKCLRSCCSTGGRAHNVSEKDYYSKDCSCKWCDIRLTLQDKAVRLLSQYHVIPSSDDTDTSMLLSWDAVIDISRSLVDEYNIWCKQFGYKSGKISKR